MRRELEAKQLRTLPNFRIRGVTADAVRNETSGAGLHRVVEALTRSNEVGGQRLL